MKITATNPPIISETAYQRGFGSDLYKHVSGLTGEERAAVRAGFAVWFLSRRCNESPHGWRVAVTKHKMNGFLPRCPRNVGLPDTPNRNPTE